MSPYRHIQKSKNTMQPSNEDTLQMLQLLHAIFGGILSALVASVADALIGKRFLNLSLIVVDIERHPLSLHNLIHASLHDHQRLPAALCRYCFLALTLLGYIHGFEKNHVFLKYWGLEHYSARFLDAWQKYLVCDGPSEEELFQYAIWKYAIVSYWLMAALLHCSAGIGGFLLLFLKFVAYPVLCAMILFWYLRRGQTFRGSQISTTGVLLTSKAAIYMLGFPMGWVRTKVESVVARVQGQLLPAASRLITRMQRRWYRCRRLPYYEFEPLSVEPQQIRLLEIERASFMSGIIKTRIRHVKIDDAPPYEALSYRWGDSTLSEEILVDGMLLSVTKSAYDLLHSRRSYWRSRLVWCDAICIDQKNLGEKSSQVNLMKQIYRTATRVVVWPGGDWTAFLAGPFLIRIFLTYRMYKNSEADFSKFLRKVQCRPHWRAVAKLFKNSYFNRIWVIQEISVGRTVQLYHGGTYIPWEVYQLVLRECYQEHRRGLLAEPNLTSMIRSSDTLQAEHTTIMSALRQDDKEVDTWCKGRLEFSNLMFACSTFLATNPADKVFALIGIAVDGNHELLRPDYTKDNTTIFTDAARFAIGFGDNATLTLAIAGVGYDRHLQDLPSWVPDLSAARPNFPLTVPNFNNLPFRAGGQTSPQVYCTTDGRQLRARAVLFDTILDTAECVGSVLSIPRKGISIKESAGHLMRFHRVARNIASTHQSLWSDQSSFDTDFRQTLIGGYRGRKHSMSPSLSDVLRGYSLWFTVMSIVDDATTSTSMIDMLKEQCSEIATFSQESTLGRNYGSAMAETCVGRRFCITKSGLMALVPPLARKGDRVAVLLGAQTPYVLRHKEEEQENAYELVGEGYFHGAMDGEALHFGEEETIAIV